VTAHADRQLRERARAVIPGGMYGHQAAPGAAYPQFMRGGRGARVWDADGNEYVDLMCSYGPVVLGHQHPKVEAAAARQAATGDCMNAPGPVMVDLAELLTQTVRHADWAILAKNGTDATTCAARSPGRQTGRSKILVATGAYHGAAHVVHAPAGPASRPPTTPTSATTPSTTWPARSRPPPRPAMTWPGSWSARSSTTRASTRSWSTPSSPAGSAPCATKKGPR